MISIPCIILMTVIPSCISYSKKHSVEKYDCTKDQKAEKIIPATPGIIMHPERCNDYIFNKQKLSKAIHIFVEEYSSTFETSELLVWEMLRGLRIEVSAIPKTVSSAYDTSGKKIQNPHVNGLALSKNHIWVEVRTSQIWTSSLVHELIHIIIWKLNDVHGDPDHEGSQFSGWTKKHTKLIKNINNRLFRLDI